MTRSIVITFIVFVFMIFSVAAEPTLKLVYKDVGSLPNMQKAPDNSGLFKDLMERAVEKIGFKLEIIRLPKKRTYYLLETGEADLYASGQFKESRSKFLFYIPNGLLKISDYYGISSIDIPEIKSLTDIKKYNLLWRIELGGSAKEKAISEGINYSEAKNIEIGRNIELIKAGRPFFVKINKKKFKKYLKKNKIESVENLGIKVHENCFESKKAILYTSFSRKSQYYKERSNPSYDKTKPLSPENFPFELHPDSVPHKLNIALKEMIESGETDLLKKKYNVD